MRIDNKALAKRIVAYNAGTISKSDHAQLWDDLIEICAYQIKKNREDRAYYDFIQDMVIYVIEHYIKNFNEFREDGTPNSALAFLLQSAYWSKLVLWGNKYKYESNEFATLNTSSADSEGNSTELVNTWSTESYADAWAHAWGTKGPGSRKKRKIEDEEETEEEKREERKRQREEERAERIAREEASQEDLEELAQEFPGDDNMFEAEADDYQQSVMENSEDYV
jgi:hypothetical protein